MHLADWRASEKLSTAETAKLLGLEGAHGSSTVWNWETGRARPDADMIDRIAQVTAGAVTPADMHAIRLDWLKANRPEKFDPSSPDSVPHGASAPAGPDAPETQSGPAFSSLDVRADDPVQEAAE